MSKVASWKKAMDTYYTSVDRSTLQRDLEASGFATVDKAMFANREVAATIENEQDNDENATLIEAEAYTL